MVASVVRAAQPAVADEALAAVQPVCADSNECKLGKWRKAAVWSSCIVVQGGFGGNKETVAPSIFFEMDGAEWIFVHLHKHARWLISAVAGPRATKGDISQVKILDIIRHTFMELNADPCADAPAVAAVVDPMDALDDVAEVDAPKPKATAKVRNIPVIPVALHMPKRPPCAGMDQRETHPIYVLFPKGENRKMYLRSDGLDWLLSYAADEYHFQNVVRQDEKPPPAVADDIVEWDFNTRAWVVTVDAGPNAGTQSFSPEDLRPHQWKKLQQLSLVDGVLSKSNWASRKMAARELAKLWCAAARKGDEHTFEQEWLYEASAEPDLLTYFAPHAKRQRTEDFAPDAAVAGDIVE